MPRLLIFYRLIVRPVFRDFTRTALTILAVALGVAVVLAISLAGNAAAGSFRSSLETMAGDSDLEVTAAGGLPEQIVGNLDALPYSIRVRPRLEALATAVDLQRTAPLIGLDLIAEANGNSNSTGGSLFPADQSFDFPNLDGVWLSADFGLRVGDKIRLRVNDHTDDYPVRGVLKNLAEMGSVVVMDIAQAQRALNRYGRLDRILLKLPRQGSVDEWQQRIAAVLPEGVQVRGAGSQTNDNRRMLTAFRLNLRVLSYIALIVGAFLIYNTISVSVVRRRAEIGIARALGAARTAVIGAFLGEAAVLGFLGGLAGIFLGRLMAIGAVQLVSATVQSLYVTSRPAPLELTVGTWFYALGVGMVVAIASAFGPAWEAAQVAPVEAMARGKREVSAQQTKPRDLLLALGLTIFGVVLAFAPVVSGLPLFGYASALCFVAASAFAMPALVHELTAITGNILRKLMGVEAMLAARGLNASLRRTSVLVAALSTAVAMMASVGIMVGSFRETVRVWMDTQLQADFYLRPAGAIAPGQHPTMAPDLPQRLETIPGVGFVDQFRAYDISYEGLPATLGGADLRRAGGYRRLTFLSRRDAADVYAQLLNQDAAVVSEPFANKHHIRAGDLITLPLSGAQHSFRVIDVYYDYSTEAGFVVLDRATLLKYLPDPAPTNIAIYAAPAANLQEVRAGIEKVTAGESLLIANNRDLREQGLRVFDRTFAVTYALEAVSVLVAVIGMAGALLALVFDRRREFGLLRFLGASTQQIRKWVLVEAGIIGLLASIAGFVLGVVLSLILIYVVNKRSFGWTIQFHWPVAVLLTSFAVVYLATVAAGLYPARIAAELNPIEVIHEE